MGKNVLIIKLSDKPGNQAKLLEKASKGWKINPSRLQNVTLMLVMFSSVVLDEFKIGPKLIYHLDTGRVDLELYDSTNESGLVGKEISYNTYNPATIKRLDDLAKKVTD